MSETSLPTRLADRALLRLSGEDVRGFLQGLVTQDTRKVAPGAPQWSALLSAQGKVLFDFLLWDGGDGAILIDAEAARIEALAKRLTLYRLRRAIAIEAVADRAVHWSPAEQPGAAADPRLAALGYRWIGAADGGDARDAWHAHRLSFGVTEGLAELGDGQTLWLECNARELNGVAFDKGCFVGQENTARMHHRAKVNRRLVVVPLADAPEDARVRYPALGLAVARLSVDAIDRMLAPAWLLPALA